MKFIQAIGNTQGLELKLRDDTICELVAIEIWLDEEVEQTVYMYTYISRRNELVSIRENECRIGRFNPSHQSGWVHYQG